MLQQAFLLPLSFFAITGFTLSLVAVPLLMPVLGAKETVVFIIFGTFLAKVAALWNTRRDFEWRTVLVTVAGSFLGSLPGSYVLNIIPSACLQVLLGIMLLATLFFMGRQFKINIKNQTAGRITAGFISGFSAAVTSISGPPIALYFLTEGRQYRHHGIAGFIRQPYQYGLNAAGGLCNIADAAGYMAGRAVLP